MHHRRRDCYCRLRPLDSDPGLVEHMHVNPRKRCVYVARDDTLKSFKSGSRRVRSRDRFAGVAKRRYRTSMNISRLLLATFFCAAASLAGNDELKERLQPALEAITPDGLLAHIKVLASDEFEGRSPGTKGEELSVKYITDQFKQIGLKPGNPDGTYTQAVPLAGIKSYPQMLFVAGDETN